MVGGMSEPDRGRVLPLWLTVVLGVAGTAGALWGIHAAAPILAPIVLAFVLTVVAHPVIGALARHRVPRGVAVAVAVLLVEGGLLAFGLALVVSFSQLATVLPQYSAEWQQLLDGLRATLTGLGIGPQQVQDMLHSLDLGAVVSAAAGLLVRLGG